MSRHICYLMTQLLEDPLEEARCNDHKCRFKERFYLWTGHQMSVKPLS